MRDMPSSLTSPNGHFVQIEQARGGAVRLLKDFVEDVAVLRPAPEHGVRTDDQIVWELEFETAYYFPSTLIAGPADRAPVEAALPYIDEAVRDA